MINVAFDFEIKNVWYEKNMKCYTNVRLDSKNKTLGWRVENKNERGLFLDIANKLKIST